MTHPYGTRAFAQSLAHAGSPLCIPVWDGYVLQREIAPNLYDAAGVYPITPIPPDADIDAGLAQLRGQGLVSAVLVLDDFHRPSMQVLEKEFSIVNPFKTHYLYRPSNGEMAYDSHHKRAVRLAYKQVRADVVDLRKDLHHWMALYDALIGKLGLTGLHAFPPAHHEALAQLEGVVAIGAWMGDELVSCHIWVDDGRYVHSHLVASDEKGYASRAAYAVNDTSLRYFAERELLNFGGGAGNSVEADDGLARFKRGFSNGTSRSYICGAVLDEEKYRELAQARKLQKPVPFFPVYRAP